MENSKNVDDIYNSITALVNWFQENLFNPIGFMQLAAVYVSYLIAWLLAAKLQQHLKKDIETDTVNLLCQPKNYLAT